MPGSLGKPAVRALFIIASHTEHAMGARCLPPSWPGRFDATCFNCRLSLTRALYGGVDSLPISSGVSTPECATLSPRALNQ